MNNLTLVIPAKYEVESLPSVLEEIKDKNCEVIIVLEESDTQTINAIKKYNKTIIYQTGKGYGNALIEGINNTKTKNLCIFNADGSFNPKELGEMLEKLNKENLDIIFASRYEKNSGSDDDTIITYVGNKCFSLIGKIFFFLPISDILYTFVMGNTEKIKNLNLSKQDFRFCIELPIKAKRKNYNIAACSSYERPRIGGRKKVNAFKDGFLILIYMISLFFNKKSNL